MSPDLSSYIEAAGNSTSRARGVLTVMVSAAFLLICAYANVLAGFRKRQVSDLEAVIDYRNSLRSSKNANATSGFPQPSTSHGLTVWDSLKSKRPAVTDDEFDAMLRVDARELRTYLLKEGASVALPIVNVAIDIRDLWVFASIGFTIIQVALIYAIAREAADIETTLKVASKDPADLRVAYDLLAMRQLFTVPPGTRKKAQATSTTPNILERIAETTWRDAPKSLLWIPVGAQLFGLIVGISSIPSYTLEHSFFPILKGYYPEFLLALLSIVLTLIASRLEVGFDQVWKTFKPK